MNKTTIFRSKMMVTTLLGAISMIGLLAFGKASVAQEAGLQIGCGSSTGSYTNFWCANLERELAKSDIPVTGVESAGSGENMDNLISGKLKAVLSQNDIAGAKIAAVPDQADSYVPIPMAQEALICAYNIANGRLKKWSQLIDSEAPNKKFVVSVGKSTSGAYGTFENVSSQKLALASNAEVKQIESTKSYNNLIELDRLGLSRDLVCDVTAPNPENSFIAEIMMNDELAFLDIQDKELLEIVDSSDRLMYKSEKVDLGKGFVFNTIATDLSLWVNVDEVDPVVYKQVKAAVKSKTFLPPTSYEARRAKALGFFKSIIGGMGGIFGGNKASASE